MLEPEPEFAADIGQSALLLFRKNRGLEDVSAADAADEFRKTVLTLRVTVSLKKQRAKAAGEHGLRGASSYARSILEKHLKAA